MQNSLKSGDSQLPSGRTEPGRQPVEPGAGAQVPNAAVAAPAGGGAGVTGAAEAVAPTGTAAGPAGPGLDNLVAAISILNVDALQRLLQHVPPVELARALERHLNDQSGRVAEPAPQAQTGQPAQPAVQPQQTPQQTPPPATAPASPSAQAPGAGTGAEKRGAPRSRTLRSGKIIFNNKMSVRDCTIRDMSSTGCRLAMESTSGIPGHFTLHIINGDTRHECEVAWRNPEAIGVKFIG